MRRYALVVEVDGERGVNIIVAKSLAPIQVPEPSDITWQCRYTEPEITEGKEVDERPAAWSPETDNPNFAAMGRELGAAFVAAQRESHEEYDFKQLGVLMHIALHNMKDEIVDALLPEDK